MNSHEEELQKKVERGEASDVDGLDVKAYQQVFHALGKDPEYPLPPGFAHRVVANVLRKQESRYSKDYFWFGAGIFFLLVVFAGTVVFVGFRLDLGFLSVMSDYKGLAIFGVSFITLLHLLDRRLVRRQANEW